MGVRATWSWHVHTHAEFSSRPRCFLCLIFQEGNSPALQSYLLSNNQSEPWDFITWWMVLQYKVDTWLKFCIPCCLLFIYFIVCLFILDFFSQCFRYPLSPIYICVVWKSMCRLLNWLPEWIPSQWKSSLFVVKVWGNFMHEESNACTLTPKHKCI